MMWRTSLRFTALLAVAALLSACASSRYYNEGADLIAQGKNLEGLERLERAVKENPRNAQFRAAYYRERERIVSMRLVEGDAALRASKFDEAETAYNQALAVDPNLSRARTGLQNVAQARKHEVLIKDAEKLMKAGDLNAAEGKLRAILSENPSHSPSREMLRQVVETNIAAEPPPTLSVPFKKPITLEFRDASMKTVFEMLSRTSGINFVFDRDVKQDQKVTVFFRNTTMEDALKLILVTNQLDRKVMNENSVLIYPNTPAKQKDYKELVVRSFYLSNADVKQASAMVKALVKTQDIFIDEKLNFMVVKDSPDVIRLTERLVRSLDLADPEVMLEVEVLEIARTRLQDLGVNWPGSVTLSDRGVTTTPGTGTGTGTGTTGTTTGSAAIDGPKFFSSSNPLLTFNLRAQVTSTNLLANPRIRVKNKEKARIHIGDKVPVFTSTAANLAVATSVSYLDVGLKLDVEPNIYLQDEVGIKVGLEVSNIVNTVTVGTGASQNVAYQIGTRNTNTVLQLKDGETQVLAGLINDEDRRSADRIPGLGDLPILDRLFGTQRTNRVKTEIVLLITPRIVRNLTRPDGVPAEMSVGTDSNPSLAPLRIGKTSPGSVAVAPSTVAGAGAIPGAATATDVAPAQGSIPIVLQGPLRAQIGKDFTVNLSAALPGTVRAGQIEIAYDPAQLQPADGQSVVAPGTLLLKSDATGFPSSVRFKVIAGAPGKTSVSVRDADIVDQGGFPLSVQLPQPVELEIAK